ncbi:MAG: RNA polymerase subunit sigma-24 [Planctomycetes bacterium]|nr:RNA polymerase subunit sigma-24 [Planctomycetota bacterium]
MSELSTFQDLIRRVRAGDGEAAAELVRLYEPAIRRAARVRLVDTRLQRLFDSMDISQSVFASFFVRAALGQYDVDRPEQLLKLLVAMSRKKLADHVRELGAARRDFRRDQGGQSVWNLPAADGNPSQLALLKDLLSHFRQRLSEEERQLADRRALNQPWEQIAAELGGSAEALRKQLARAIDRISRELGLDQDFHE